ncbi:MAG TPA: hypothetical protein VJB08_03050 [Candidatus Nanoarchaeia archaeon]|nr:hypothetical protein [Candidatus Nanoarchaeia archaeon]
MGKIKQIFQNIRVIIMGIVLILAIVAISPNPFSQGVAIRSVTPNSSAAIAGIENPPSSIWPMGRERIVSIDNNPIRSEAEYYSLISGLEPNQTLNIKTGKKLYKLRVKEKVNTTELNESEDRVIEESIAVNETIDGTVQEINRTIKRVIRVPKIKREVLGAEDIGLRIFDAPVTNIRKGLDLQGGVRVILQPEEAVSEAYMLDVIATMEQRLNVFGLSDVVLRSASDLDGNLLAIVEIPGANEEEVRDLIGKQGKFEAKISNETVFKGGEDITYVCRSAECAGIDPARGCGITESGLWACSYRFSITLSPDAAKKQAQATEKLSIVTEGSQRYLSEELLLFLDNSQVDSLSIAADLKGREVTDIQISGSAGGASKQEATTNALQGMKKLQTLLITGSLPVKLNVVKADTISPLLGEEFLKSTLWMGIAALLAVSAVIYARYRRMSLLIPMAVNIIVEVVIMLGVAALIGWNIDLASIAGIIVSVGTGVDQLIMIADEILLGESQEIYDWKRRLKNAFFIIMGAYFTVVVAMVPLMFAGAGLLRGFAITTIIGVSIGVFISRPAYAKVLEILLRE